MLFGKTKEKRLAAALQNGELDQRYWAIVQRQFRRNRLAVWSLRILYGLLFIALFADFIANERPLYCKIDGQTYFPVLRQYAVNLGLARWEEPFINVRWHDLPYEKVIFPPVPYSYNTIDRRNMGYVAPFAEQKIATSRFRHWLGTDRIGRDVLAGMIAGTRTAMLVGVIAMAIATLIGVFMGAVAGYFGDERLRVSRLRLWLNVLALWPAVFYGFVVRRYAMTEGSFTVELGKSLGIFIGAMLAANLLATLLKKVPAFGKKVTIPADMLVMRTIEVVDSIPGLLLILSVVAVIKKPSIFYIMVIIGLISWMGIARFIRAELLRIRSLSYIEAAQAMGFSHWRIIVRHALPNALTPVLITVAFGIASAILLEAFLSFLGVGVAADQVTWGSMLSAARARFAAWWLAIFPGVAIFITVTLFNLIGEGLTDALDPRRKGTLQ